MKLYTLKVKGMRSALDVSNLERLLKNIDGVDAVNINVVNAVVKVRCADETELEAITSVITANGYALYDKDELDTRKKFSGESDRNIFLHIIIFTGILIAAAGLFLHEQKLVKAEINLLKGLAAAEFILCSVALYSARTYLSEGINELFSGNPRMTSLPVLGCLTGYLYSAVNVYYAFIYSIDFAYHLYFLPVALLLLLHKVGSLWLSSVYNIKSYEPLKEDRSQDQVLLIKGEEPVEITSDLVLPGDVVSFRCGQTVYAEGTVVAGEAAVDEGAVNGTSMPVLKKKGDTIFFGSVLCGGSINLQVNAVEQSSEYTKQKRDCDLAAVFTNDAKAAVYLPFIMIVAIVACLNWFFYTGNFNESLRIVAVVLLLSAPELIKISVALSVKSALKKSRKQGIFFKTIQALLDTAQASIAVIGKTATLAGRNVVVTDIVTFNGVNEQSAVCLASSLENDSLHPIAMAIKNCITQSSTFDCSNIKYSPGCGVTGVHQRVKVALGTYDYMRKICRIPEYIKQQDDAFAAAGKTVVYLAAQNQICAIFAVAEELHEEDKQGIKKLYELELRTMMVTGDCSTSAERAAKYFQITRFLSELSIKDKCQLLQSLQQGGEKVAVFSENQCDKMLYKYADIGVSMSSVTKGLADVILAKHDFGLFAQAMQLSRSLLLKIKKHLQTMFIFNAVAVIAVLCCLYSFAEIVLHPVLVTAVILLNFLLVIITA